MRFAELTKEIQKKLNLYTVNGRNVAQKLYSAGIRFMRIFA